MLNDLSGLVKASHFIGRLNDKRFENALPAEAELGLVWAISQLGGFESEPAWFSPKGKRPEGISTSLIPGHQTVFDVKAVSDRVMPGNVGMRKISRKLMEEANRIKKGTGNSLEFFFAERRDYQVPKNHRGIWAPPDYKPQPAVVAALRSFIESGPTDGQFVDIQDVGLAVRVTWKTNVFSLFNYRSSTVNEIFDIDDNHIAKALREKAAQLRSPHFIGVRGIMLADIGCSSLKRIDGIDPLGRSLSGRKIIQHFLDNCDGALDFVCVFSTRTERNYIAGTHHFWQVTVVVRTGLDLPMDGLKALAGQLPEPRFDSYELEHLHEQRLFGEQSRGWYLGCTMTSNAKDDKLTVVFSARALHEFLAGRISGDRLRDQLIKGTGAFEYQLKRGNTIRSASIVSKGIDEDDDLIELTFEPDPAASAFFDPAEMHLYKSADGTDIDTEALSIDGDGALARTSDRSFGRYTQNLRNTLHRLIGYGKGV